MQATSYTFQTASGTRLIAALASALISTTLLGSVVLAFDPSYAGAMSTALISATLLAGVVIALAMADSGDTPVGQSLPARIS